jgi:hypothetical protein
VNFPALCQILRRQRLFVQQVGDSKLGEGEKRLRFLIADRDFVKLVGRRNLLFRRSVFHNTN